MPAGPALAATAIATTSSPLSASAIRTLLHDTPADVARRIAAATLGNPLFALEVARAHPRAGAELPVPAAVEELLAGDSDEGSSA